MTSQHAFGPTMVKRLSRAGALMLSALVLAPDRPVSAQTPIQPAQNALAGSWVFGAKGCATCHAINGLGGTVGPDLGKVGTLRSFYDLASAFWNHYPGMMAQMRAQNIQPPHMSPREMGDLIAFLTSINYFDVPGDREKGRALFAAKQCVRCHQVGGVGGVVGPNLDYLGQMGSFIEVATALWNHGPAMSEAMATLNIPRPQFTAAELTDLVAYLRGATPGPPQGPMYVLPGRATLGRKWFTEKGCVNCHSVRGRGGAQAADLAMQNRSLSLAEFAVRLWNKGPAMQRVFRGQGMAVPQLEVGQMADIVAYLYSVRYFQRLGDAGAGRRVMQGRGCLGCHSLRGRGGGGKDAGDLADVKHLNTPTAVIAALWNHGRIMWQAAEGQVIWPTFIPEEMADLAAYFVEQGAPE